MSTSGDQNYQRIQRIFLEALDLPPGEARDAYLKDACGGDGAIRESLDALLEEYEAGAESAATCVDAPASPALTSSATETTATFIPGRILADRYRIVSMIGKGGMGEVYRADDLKLEQPVALKFLPAALAGNASLLKALYNEVRQARRVSHRHVCRVYDIGMEASFWDESQIRAVVRHAGAMGLSPEEFFNKKWKDRLIHGKEAPEDDKV